MVLESGKGREHTMVLLEKSQRDPIIDGLKTLLNTHKDKRILVIGTTCSGKSTLVAQIPGARDQDKEIFPKLTKAESDYVCQVPWTPDIGQTMTRLVRERIASEVGRPLFGTVTLPCDLIILLRISDSLLRQRTEKRGADFVDAKNMQLQLEREVREGTIPWLDFQIG